MDCDYTEKPVKFEAKCFFDALMVAFPWLVRTQEQWCFLADHEENSVNSRVYVYGDEGERYVVYKYES